jgi:tetratricopeptide (TPR) repeat protein
MRQRFTVFIGLFLLAIAAAPAGFANQNAGVALLIGNAVYPDAEAPLTEPVNDVRALGDELRRRGFDVTIGENLKKAAMQKALDQFYGKINSSSTALIFFSGFGIQSDRRSYMIPVDAQIWNESDVRRDGFGLDNVLAEMTNRGAQVKIAIIDASRRNPFERRFRSVSAGLAAVTAPGGTVVMTSAPPDTVVDTSPPVFMTELLAELKAPDATIEQTFNRTRMDVSRQTRGQQVPWFSSSLDQDVTLGSPSHAAPAPATPTPVQPSSPPAAVGSVQPAGGAAVASADPEAEVRHDYVLTENIGTKQAWDDFVKRHPTGYYYDLAEQQIAKLTPAAADDTNPTDLPGFYRRGQHRAINGDYKLAVEDFAEVIRRDPNHAGALNDRCWVRALIGELQEALKDCNAALRIAPDYPDALDSRGLVNLKLGMFNKAIADYDAALVLDPNHASALYGRGIAKRRSGDAAGGKSDIDAAKAIKSTIADEFASYGIR